MGDLIIPATIARQDTCVACRTNRAIECINRYGKVPIQYSMLLDRLDYGYNLDDLLKKNELSYFRCRRCGKIYDISWNIEKGIPEPLLNNSGLGHFLDNFNKK